MHGLFRSRPQQILIRPGMAVDHEVVTVMHELLHAVTEMCGLDHRLGVSEEEDVVTTLAPALVDVLRRNPELVAYLMGSATC